MIETMNKYSFLVFEPEYEAFLQKLRSLGVIHVRQNKDPNELDRIREVKARQDELADLRKSLGFLMDQHPLQKEQTPEDIRHIDFPEETLTDYDTYVNQVSDLDARIREKSRILSDLKSQEHELSYWGDFDPTLISKLRAKGVNMTFWTVLSQRYNKEWEGLYHAQIIQTAGRSTYFVTITSEDEPEPELEYAERVRLPDRSISSLRVERQSLEEELRLLTDSKLYLAHHDQILDKQEAHLADTYQMDNAYYQADRLYDDRLMVLEGYVPVKQDAAMQAALSEEGIAYVQEEIVYGEDVPIKLSNSRFGRAFEPLVKMFSLPNYWEFDPTPFIAPFFMLFFGMCSGDAGYGLVVLILATIFKRKVGESAKMYLELFQWLGGAAVVMGFLAGTFFGISLVEVPFLSSIKDFFLSSDNLMVISLALGLVQILFAKYVAAFKVRHQSGIRASLASFAWPTLVIFIGLVVGLPALSIQLPQWLEYTLWGVVGLCVFAVFFLNSPGKSVFVNLGKGLWDTYNTASGLLGDTLSYIRLFAIGLTGGILGGVFNTLTETVTSSMPIWAAIPVGLLILAFGHGLNFCLTMISSLVHPVRLTYVEYFNNSEYEGGGTPYTPIEEKVSK